MAVRSRAAASRAATAAPLALALALTLAALFAPAAAQQSKTCTAHGDRVIGAPGKPHVPWFRCCDNADTPTEDSSRGWGKFCLGGSGVGGSGSVQPSGADTLSALAQGVQSLSKAPEQAKLFGLSFGPFTLGSDVTCRPAKPAPGDTMCASKEKVNSDLNIIRGMTRRIRTYSLTCEEASFETLKFAKENGMQVMLGIWISKDKQQNEAELQRLEKALNMYGEIVSHVLVGNEPVFILQVAESDLAEYIRRVRGIFDKVGSDKRPKGGVGTADIFNAWQSTCTVDNAVRSGFNMKEVVSVSDFIGLNQHAFWGGAPPEVAALATVNGANQVSQTWGGKQVIITETGYPTAGPSHKPTGTPECPSSVTTTAVPGVKALEKFLTEMEKLSRERKIIYYAFEPFDSQWKSRWEAGNNAGATDEHWGIMTCDRKMKDITLPSPGAVPFGGCGNVYC